VRKMPLRMLCLLMVLCLAPFAVFAQDAGSSADNQANAANTDHTPPSYDMKAQALLDLGQVQKKFVDLADAFPADKFTWRPSEDSRSFAEVLLHVAGERYQILALGGATPPSDFHAKEFEKSTTDRPEDHQWHDQCRFRQAVAKTRTSGKCRGCDLYPRSRRARAFGTSHRLCPGKWGRTTVDRSGEKAGRREKGIGAEEIGGQVRRFRKAANRAKGMPEALDVVLFHQVAEGTIGEL
jgi:hypothetical protein